MDIKFKRIYETLNDFYGYSGWWPLISKSGQTNYNDSGYKIKPHIKELNYYEKLEISIGAILTQNTTWLNAKKALYSIITKIGLNKLKETPQNELSQIIKSCGYFNQKSKKIKILLENIDFNSSITRNDLLEVWGIGPETADCILLYALNFPIFVVDAYTKRLFSRVFGEFPSKYDDIQELFHKNLKTNLLVYQNYHGLIVNHCKNSCKKSPNCSNCILNNICTYCKSNVSVSNPGARNIN